jgi:hypothetical protein
MKKLLALGVTLGLVALLVPSQSEACRCVPPRSPKDNLAAHDAVFQGKVIYAAPVGPNAVGQRSYVFRVSKIWKGNLPNRVKVLSNASPVACGMSFSHGRSYLIYASMGTGRTLSTSSCSSNKSGAAIAADARALGRYMVPTLSNGRCPPGTENLIRCITAPCPGACTPKRGSR